MSNEDTETQYAELSPVRPISYKASGGKRKARKASKKASKKTSKKVTRKVSKKTSSKKGRKMARSSKKVSRKGSKKVSRKGSKKASKKGSRKGSKKGSRRSMKRNNPLNSPGVVAWKALLDKVTKKVGFGGPIAMGIAKHYKEKAASQLGDSDTIKACKKAQELFDKESNEDIKKVTEKVKVESAKKRAVKKAAKKEKMAKRATNYSETSN
ncbi:hypothetical protein Hokovirus_2_127 [Hokovirus HKV1]|uniref:Uncharacterized protein n=1 Tax=Hokovirus HKV1 TaxID=1977638 RepID=A0A1V0SFV5_9VIRU|nr:hypothetical protein Hokovirus_2_127 [Hokovirus HKV1]